MEKNVTIRMMTAEDIEAVHHVELQSFSVPWTKESFYNEVVHNMFATYLVAEIEGEIVGYCGLWVIIDEAQITNIAVLPEYRGNSIGEHLLRKASRIAKKRGAVKLSLEVRVSNYAAQGLYRKLGFEPGGVRKNYYTDNLEDALVMWVSI
ncbi:ribosomal protein S18-alanine N-acetyltransferase [Metabacillus kandeliae]|uniref:ribosomal protein S18-alanine N-acetyltransferase n=1 Tax=Metabacillus kandeliae TaxID=2900151 RepID=UPI0038CC1203